jgi:hypothetical protein
VGVIDRENIPVVDLYFSRNGMRYRSLGCAPCTKPIQSGARTVPEIIEELRDTRISERSTRGLQAALGNAVTFFAGFTFGPDPFVDRKVIRGHPVRAKSLLKFVPATLSVDQTKSIDGCDGIALDCR